MSDRTLTDALSSKLTLGTRPIKWERFALLYARFALGAAFLSAVAARFGIWGENTGPDSFKTLYGIHGGSEFLHAGVHDSVSGLGCYDRRNLPWHYLSFRNLGSFRRSRCGGVAGLVWHRHAISFGIKSPLDYSVFSVSAGALLLAICQIRKAGGKV
jgi:putative oxidoreductase